jgi:hypothetical protein
MDNSPIIIDISGASTLGFKEFSNSGVVASKSAEMFNHGMELIEKVTNAFVKKIGGLESPPEEFSVEFGIGFKADLGAIIAKTSAEANFTIQLKWKRGN